MDDKIRCFIALTFPDEVIKEIARVQELVGNKKFDGKLTELENLHLTLKFLGEIDEGKLEEVKKRLKKIKFSEMSSSLGRMGLFSYRKNPRIVWVKINGKDIIELQKKIDEGLKELFEIEERFMSHLTIARVKFVKDKIGFNDHINGIGVKNIRFNVDNFKLIKSELRPQGPVYEVIEEFKADN